MCIDGRGGYVCSRKLETPEDMQILHAVFVLGAASGADSSYSYPSQLITSACQRHAASV